MNETMPFARPGGYFFGIKYRAEEHQKLFTNTLKTLALLSNSNKPGSSAFASDSMICFARSLGFLHEEKFAACAKGNEDDPIHSTILWRTHVLCWAATHALNLDGDFVELGCYNGKTARFVYDYTDLGNSAKRYFLYDLFEKTPDTGALPEHSEDILEVVKDRFHDAVNVNIVKGRVPESLEENAPDRISFMHLDMNAAEPEIGALEKFFDRMVPGGLIVLDDYGWAAYRPQMDAELQFMRERGHMILELPTGQGMVIKH